MSEWHEVELLRRELEDGWPNQCAPVCEECSGPREWVFRVRSRFLNPWSPFFGLNLTVSLRSGEVEVGWRLLSCDCEVPF